MNRPEQAIQIACARYLLGLETHLRTFTFCHTPNGGKRTKAEAGIFKAMGVRAGFPDLMILPMTDKPPFFVELKAKAGALSPAQKVFHAILNTLGYEVHTITAENPTDGVIQLGRILQNKGIVK